MGRLLEFAKKSPEVFVSLNCQGARNLVKSDYISVRTSTNFTLGMATVSFFLLMNFCSILSYDLRSLFKATQFQKCFKMLNFSTCPGYCFTSTSNMTSLIVIFTWLPI